MPFLLMMQNWGVALASYSLPTLPSASRSVAVGAAPMLVCVSCHYFAVMWPCLPSAEEQTVSHTTSLPVYVFCHSCMAFAL